MIHHQEIQKDTYITDKIVGSVRRSTDANLGHASTLDLFKLWNESNMKGEASPILERSHILIKADLDELKANLEQKLDLADSSLKIKLVLKDIQGTQIAPSGFSIDLIQLEQDWQEGEGKDIATLADVMPCNWLSSTGDTLWENPGGLSDLPTIIESSFFEKGNEDLSIDITNWVKSVWNNDILNHGWLIKFSQAQDTDEYSYFVKRFASRHTRNPYNKPKLIVSWDDYHEDDRLQFETSTQNILTIRHYVKGDLKILDNVTSTLTYGDWILSGSVSQVSIGGILQEGWYQAAYRGIEIYSDADSLLRSDLLSEGEISLTESWYSNNALWYQTSVRLKRNLVTTNEKPRDYRFSLTSMKEKYTHSETPVARLFVRDTREDNDPVRVPYELPSKRVERAYYRIKDYGNQKEPIVDFSYPYDDSTRISADGDGMYFKFPVDLLPHGRTFTIDVLYFDRGKSYIWESNLPFTIEGE